jgi:ubiquinone/menaquinone biosynthesis C-methylase UbiE
MGDWSRRVGTVFIDWLAPPSGLNWIDVGCGNGAFTELIVERCAPNEVRGIDPSDAQLDFARKRSAARLAKFDHGDGMALPFSADTFDVAIMALVIVFVPDPARGVAEMKRVVRPGHPAPICGTYWAAVSHWSRSALSCAKWDLNLSTRQVSKPLELKQCVICGLERASRQSKHER